MRIGIVGSGYIGGTLTGRLRELGHDVRVSNSRGPESLAGLADETGAIASTVADAIGGGELVIVSVPLKAIPDLPADLFAGKRVVDTGNYYPARDGQIHEIDSGTPSTRWVAQHLRGARVVKAFNTIQAAHLSEGGLPGNANGRIALPVAGDDGETKQIVMKLIDELGFDSVDAGTLDDSWRQQPDTPVYGADLDIEGVEEGLTATER
ncbi:MAG TPA: NADPH-dependent F420 reductase [Thermoleophilaceae bacterium]